MSSPRWALVTGASSGLGVAFARRLAADGASLVLTARRVEPMETLAAELKSRHGVEVVVEAADLSAPDAASQLLDRIAARGIELDTLINNAGFGLSGMFLDQNPAQVRQMLNLNILSLTELSLLAGRRMAARGGGQILLVGSMASYQPTPGLAAYGASKAYVLSFGEALNVELAGKVKVTVLSPGLMETGFADAAGYTAPEGVSASVLPPADVARIGLAALTAGKSGVIAGGVNRAMALASRFFTRHAAARMVMRMAR